MSKIRIADNEKFCRKMERTKAGQDRKILFHVFGGEMRAAKIRTVKGLRAGIFSRSSSPDGLDRDSRNGHRTLIVFSGKMCYTWPDKLTSIAGLFKEKHNMDKKKVITLGSYPQNSELREPIEWIVLKQETGQILCISRFLLDCKPYHETSEDVTWENCSLREWLNNYFFITAFTKEEQKRIQITNIETPLHNTKDHIFLLSCEEADTYFSFDERAAKTTQYARKQGAWFLDDNNDEYYNNGTWWLRYPELLDEDIEEGESELYTILSCVNFDGYIEGAAEEASGIECCVRPAFWLKVE